MPEQEPRQLERVNAPAETLPEAPPAAGQARALLSGMFKGLRQLGRDALSVALGRVVESPEELPSDVIPPDSSAAGKSGQRVGMLHGMAEQLRGAADSYVAAKLDELEARVDMKLDHIEERIDRKIVELHRQLAEMRDRELRHRLRLLKITLVFTVLVAALSLVYKWASLHWIS